VANRAVLSEGVLDPYRLALFRYLIASLVLLAVAAVARIRIPRAADLPRLALTGILGVGVYNACLNLGQSQMKAGAASFIVNTIPLFTAVLSVLILRDRLRAAGFAGMVISFLGIVLIALGEGRHFQLNAGAWVILAAAVAWSIATILQKPLLQRYRAIEIVAYAIWSGTAALMIFAPGLGGQIVGSSLRSTLLVVYLGVFPAAIAYVCWAFVLSTFAPARAASFLYLIPPVSTLIEIGFLGDLPGRLSLIGGGLALGGVILSNTLGRPAPATKPARLP
jgi:drug/metabolite transporter (DMT)-like permease